MSEHEPPVLVATTVTVAGHRVVRTLGYLEARSPAMLCERASAQGANAVVDVRWANRQEPLQRRHPLHPPETRPEMVERSFLYGTMVVIEPEAG